MSMRFNRLVPGAIVALTLFAASGYANQVQIQFGTTTDSGSYAMSNSTSTFSSGSYYTLSSLTNILFTTLSVNGDAVNADNTSWNLSDGTGTGLCTGGTSGAAALQMTGSGASTVLSLYGAVTNLSALSTGCNLLATITGSFAVLDNSGKGLFDLTHFSGLTLTLNSSLLSDLSLSSSAPTILDSGSAISTTTAGTVGGSSPNFTDTFTPTSEQVTFDISQSPEPSTFLLLGAGFGILGLLSLRKRSLNNPAQNVE